VIVKSITPDWKVPSFVHGCVTLRQGGFSDGVYQGLNMATHVADNNDLVLKNRQLVSTQLQIPSKPQWLNQTHSTDVIELPFHSDQHNNKADAVWTNKNNVVCAILTADCLPVFFYHPLENSIAVAHAGWRGLAAGIIENTISAMTSSVEYLKVWLGPAIGPRQFEVGEEVRDIFCEYDPEVKNCFSTSIYNDDEKHFMADIYRLAKARLYNAGVRNITGGNYCTFSEPQHFYSYRRDGESGRMANLLWLSEH